VRERKTYHTQQRMVHCKDISLRFVSFRSVSSLLVNWVDVPGERRRRGWGQPRTPNQPLRALRIMPLLWSCVRFSEHRFNLKQNRKPPLHPEFYRFPCSEHKKTPTKKQTGTGAAPQQKLCCTTTSPKVSIRGQRGKSEPNKMTTMTIGTRFS